MRTPGFWGFNFFVDYFEEKFQVGVVEAWDGIGRYTFLGEPCGFLGLVSKSTSSNMKVLSEKRNIVK